MQSNANRDASCVSPPGWKPHTEILGQNPKDFFWTLKNTTSFPLWELQAKPCDRRGERVTAVGCRTRWGSAGRSVRSLPSICFPPRDPFGIQVLANWWREDGIGMQLCPPWGFPSIWEPWEHLTEEYAKQPSYVDLFRLIFWSRCPTGCGNVVSDERKQLPPLYCQGFIVLFISELSFHFISSRCYSRSSLIRNCSLPKCQKSLTETFLCVFSEYRKTVLIHQKLINSMTCLINKKKGKSSTMPTQWSPW